MQTTNTRDNTLLLEVKACGISSLDLEMRSGKYQNLHGKLPHVLGYEVAGVVREIGEEVSRFSIGDEVVAFLPIDQQGGNGNYVVVEDCFVVHKPKNISWEESAGAISAGIRAETALNTANPAPGDSILILDGEIFDQYIAIQFCLARGLTVFTTSRHHGNDQMDSHKLLDCVPIIPEEDLWKGILERTSGLGVDILLEPPSYYAERSKNYNSPAILQCLATHGTWITSRNIQIDPPASSILMLKSIKLSFAFEQTWVLSGAQQGIFLHLFADFMEKLGEGLISSRIDKIFKLDRISEAHSYFQSNPTKKIVLLPATK